MNSPDFPDTAVFAHTSHAHRSPWSTEPILELSHVSAHYPALDPGADDKVGPAQIHDVNLTLNEGEILLVVGRTGSGKSTLLGTITGQMPHTTGGLLRGAVKVVGRDTRDYPPRLLSDVIGVVGHDPGGAFHPGLDGDGRHRRDQVGATEVGERGVGRARGERHLGPQVAVRAHSGDEVLGAGRR